MVAGVTSPYGICCRGGGILAFIGMTVVLLVTDERSLETFYSPACSESSEHSESTVYVAPRNRFLSRFKKNPSFETFTDNEREKPQGKQSK